MWGDMPVLCLMPRPSRSYSFTLNFASKFRENELAYRTHTFKRTESFCCEYLPQRSCVIQNSSPWIITSLWTEGRRSIRTREHTLSRCVHPHHTFPRRLRPFPSPSLASRMTTIILRLTTQFRKRTRSGPRLHFLHTDRNSCRHPLTGRLALISSILMSTKLP
ncbi:hypothetical protein PAXRUDRAFT_249944 [Paxillus rubicundulus Ve08.2h10]|uniref:Uncharacterized protein n=1 Tax=Paxillus rubicundulus Ve08.2h10 TaxID=930991 RepID=A0A0D0D8M6_9AGAM|nr:hypothetical protein PAXRUDRAFT_249944 [Paxillus rubicundulus Ve08.2h10]